MNHDHLLTRIYDTQEKKMLYSNDEYGARFILAGIEHIALAFTSKGIMYRRKFSYSSEEYITTEPFGNRYVPMLCAAYKDCDNKLIYEHDIIKTPYAEYVVERYKGMFIANYIDDYFTLDDTITQLKNANVPIEISGNIHENLNPLTKKETNHGK